MNKEKKHLRFYQGAIAGVCLQSFFLLMFLIIISSPDGFDLFGLVPILVIIILFTISIFITYFLEKRKYTKGGNGGKRK